MKMVHYIEEAMIVIGALCGYCGYLFGMDYEGETFYFVIHMALMIGIVYAFYRNYKRAKDLYEEDDKWVKNRIEEAEKSGYERGLQEGKSKAFFEMRKQ